MNRRVPEHGHRLYLCEVAGVAEAFEHHLTGLPAATLFKGGAHFGQNPSRVLIPYSCPSTGFLTKQPTRHNWQQHAGKIS